jgi:hypothetical protein
MATISLAVETDGAPETSARPESPAGPFLAGLRLAFLMRVRGSAWRVLHVATEFEALD